LALAVIRDLGLDNTRYVSLVAKGEKGLPLDQSPITRERMAKRFKDSLTVESPTDTRLINISFQDPDRMVAADVANALTDSFIKETLERRHRSTSQSSFWLQKELAELKSQVERSEKDLANYERKTGMAGVELIGGPSDVSIAPHNTVTERLFTLNQELTSAESARISAETVYNLVHTQDPEVVLGLGTGAGSSLTSDAGIDLVRSLRSQEASLERERAGAAVKYGTNNPRLVQILEQLSSNKQAMQAELKRIDGRARNAYEYAKENEANIRKEFVKQQSAANVLADATVQLHVLAQEAYSNRSLYESLFSKLQTASLASGVGASRIDVVEKAVPPGIPSNPNPKLLAAIFGLALFCGVSAAFASESFDETLRTSEDVESIENLPALGYIPRQMRSARSSDSELILAPLSPFSEAFRSLRTSIFKGTRSSTMRTLLITSPLGGAGKTTVAYNLGVAFAQQGTRVLLIDGDFRNPTLNRSFNALFYPGLSDVGTLDGGIPFVVRHDVLSTLFLLPAGRAPGLPAEYFASPTFEGLLQAAAGEFDMVILDSPPILQTSDTTIMAEKVDGIIGVLRSRSTTRSTYSSFIKTIRRTEVPVIGFVLNDVHHPTLDGFHEYSYKRQGEYANAD
jgi:succinoglycan biosynthesis transport protein ExoP